MVRKSRMLAWVQLWCVGACLTSLGAESTLFLEGGTLNDVVLTSSAAEITLPAGAAISGTLQVRSTALAPSLIVATPTWGPHIHAFWGVNVDVPLGEEFLSFAVDIVAPPVEGNGFLREGHGPAGAGPYPSHEPPRSFMALAAVLRSRVVAR